MAEARLGLFSRLLIALRAFWRILLDPSVAESFQRLREPGADVEPAGRGLVRTGPDSALQLLGLLQQVGRFVDFLEEDVSGYSDAEIGAAVRVVHEGCRKTLREHFILEPARPELEGSKITLAEGFDPAFVRLTGNVVGRPPYSGTLVHRGWRVLDVKLPLVAEGHDLRVLAPAEVEL